MSAARPPEGASVTAALTGSPDQRLAALGLALPRVPRPIANFVPYRGHGGLLYLAGQTCERDGVMVYRGKVGREHDLDTGIEAARLCALNLIAALRQACHGSLDAVTGCLRVGGFVNCDPAFDKVPMVINGASDLFVQLFGDAGLHARTAIGVAALPQGAAVEVDAIFEIDLARLPGGALAPC